MARGRTHVKELERYCLLLLCWGRHGGTELIFANASDAIGMTLSGCEMVVESKECKDRR